MASRRQRLASILLIGFFLVLAGLTLFSNTIQTAMLPKVTTEKASQKTLSHRIEGSGMIVPHEQTDLISESGWKVVKVHVGRNKQVKKGQVLITFDGSEAQQQLLDAEDELKKRNLNRETLKEQYIAAKQAGDETAIRKAKRDLETDRLDLEIAQRKIDRMRNELARHRTLTAPFDGKVTDIKAEEGMNVPAEQQVLTVVKAGESYEFPFTADKAAAALLQLGEKVDVVINGDSRQRHEGKISEITDTPSSGRGGGIDSPGETGGSKSGSEDSSANGSQTVVVSVSGTGLQGGEKASFALEKQAKEQGLVIGKKLLKHDGTGNYLFVIRENKSSLGNTYTAQKAYVQTGEEIGEEIIILGGISPQEDIIAESSEPLQAGNRVRFQ
ncbi:efflux RND transporter periplasmic adaptor subunit [Paenibacillus spongiae]|uniref:HlyD family efflux transporter periplasmic adaptor subunit n=1 Tax=Paenibacillus spongiae TaxID=2909671 RepID=A0ABY5S6J5_9BACL|nr:HlyD family efflux transporter periplasmic adaptor subunit [Paenibacillus spongiae]UVI27943.1 HlyD family efflux transporter periplasmic adaptor subunit [Paenibacillus spongiae]